MKAIRHRLAEIEAAEGRAAPAPAPAPAAAPAPAPAPSSSAALLDPEEARQRDIARNVDFLRVLAGEKSKLAAPSASAASILASGGKPLAFAGSGNKLGGTGAPASAGPTLADTTTKKVIVKGEIKTVTNMSASMAENERAKRAAAAEARMKALAAAQEGSS